MMKLYRLLPIIALNVLLVAGAYAQGRGNLRGQVRDENGGILPGAAVIIKGTTLGTSTDINGVYMLQGIAAGNVEVSVDYLGYDNLVEEVFITAGATENKNFTMRQLSQSIESVTVTAMIDGQQRALNQQKVASNLMQVLSADQIGMFPDLNVADALKRVSGVTSDGSKVSLRGTPTNFTNININGEQMVGTSEGGVRAPSLDLIPSDVLASMEVQKTLLPSNDGDAIGGVINLRSGEARSLKPKFNLDLGPGYNFLREKASVNLKAGYAQRFKPTGANPNGIFGISAKYSFMRSHTGYDRIEAKNWLESAVYNANPSNGPDAELSEETKWIPSDFRYRYQETKSTRQGATLVLDWAPTLSTKFVLMAGYNSRKEDSERWRNRSRMRKRDAYWDMSQLEVPDYDAVIGDLLANSGDPSFVPDFKDFPYNIYGLVNDEFGPNAVGGDRLQSITQYTSVLEKTDNYNVNFSGETVIGRWKVDGSVAYSYSKTDYESFMPGFQTPDYRGGANSNGTGSPAFQPTRRHVVGYIPDITSRYLQMNYLMKATGETAGVALDDPSRYYLYIVENWNHVTEGKNLTAQLNSSYSHFIGDAASTLSFGVKGKFVRNNGYVPEGGSATYNYSLPSGAMPDQSLSLVNMLYKDNLSSNFLNGNLNFGLAADGDKVRQGMANNNFNGLLKLDENSTNGTRDTYYFDAKEHIWAGYVMEKVQLNKLMILGGVRLEHNKMSYKANTIFRYDKDVDLSQNPSGQKPENLEDGMTPVHNAYVKTPQDSTINYVKVLPNLQFKYDLDQNTILRLAYTTGYSRPNTMDLVPKADINTDLGVVTVGNPELKPAYAHNLDILAEHYLRNVGLISGGFFYKNIDKFQYLSQMALDPSSQYSYNNSPFTLMRQQRNGNTAKVYGAEVTLNSTLTFLPGFLKNLVFTSNYTYVKSNADVERMDPEGASDAIKDRIRLPGQATHTANFALAYSTKRFTIQAAYNYIGSYIVALGADKNQDVWLDGRWQLDLNGSVNIVKGLSFWMEAQNVLNQEKYQYFGDRSRVYELQYNGASARCGFTYNF